MSKSKSTKIQPRGKWLLVRPSVDETKKTEHGLILPANEESEQKSQGVVEAKGDQASPDLGVGSVVIYGTYAGENLKINENGKEVDYKLLLDEDIIAFVN